MTLSVNFDFERISGAQPFRRSGNAEPLPLRRRRRQRGEQQQEQLQKQRGEPLPQQGRHEDVDDGVVPAACARVGAAAFNRATAANRGRSSFAGTDSGASAWRDAAGTERPHAQRRRPRRARIETVTPLAQRSKGRH